MKAKGNIRAGNLVLVTETGEVADSQISLEGLKYWTKKWSEARSLR